MSRGLTWWASLLGLILYFARRCGPMQSVTFFESVWDSSSFRDHTNIYTCAPAETLIHPQFVHNCWRVGFVWARIFACLASSLMHNQCLIRGSFRLISQLFCLRGWVCVCELWVVSCEYHHQMGPRVNWWLANAFRETETRWRNYLAAIN